MTGILNLELRSNHFKIFSAASLFVMRYSLYTERARAMITFNDKSCFCETKVFGTGGEKHFHSLVVARDHASNQFYFPSLWFKCFNFSLFHSFYTRYLVFLFKLHSRFQVLQIFLLILNENETNLIR